MEFPRVNQICVESFIECNNWRDLFLKPEIHGLDMRLISEEMVKNFLGFVKNNKFTIFPFGLHILINENQKKWICEFKELPLVNFFYDEEKFKNHISKQTKKSDASKFHKDYVKLLTEKTNGLLSDSINLKVIKELGLWNSNVNKITREINYYNELLKNDGGQDE